MSEKNTCQRRLVACLVVASVFVFLIPNRSVAEVPTSSRDAVNAEIQKPAIQAMSADLNSILDTEPTDWSRAISLLENPHLSSTEHEFLTSRLLYRARSRAPDSIARKFVESMSTHRSQTFVWHEEGPLPVEAFPVAQLASGTLLVWDTEIARLSAQREFQDGQYAALGYLRTPGGAAYRGTMRALKSASAVEIAAAKEWLFARPNNRDFYEARTFVALQAGDRSLVTRLLQDGHGAAAVALTRSLAVHFDADTTFEMLRSSMSNPKLASVAVTEIERLRGALVTHSVDDFMLTLLADPALGGTAAAMIARHGDEGVLRSVAAILIDVTTTPQQQARAVLALRLADTQFSRLVLDKAWSSGAIRDPHLREEVAKWLNG